MSPTNCVRYFSKTLKIIRNCLFWRGGVKTELDPNIIKQFWLFGKIQQVTEAWARGDRTCIFQKGKIKQSIY